MGIYGSGSVSGATSSVIIAGFLCLGVILLSIAAVIVLSLISLYTPNHSEQGYGEQYQIKAFFIQALSQNISFQFLNGTVADSTALSNLCGLVYATKGALNFAGCVATNFNAFGPFSAKRRRQIASPTLVKIYEIGQVNLYYSTSCPKKGDVLQYANATSLSNCVKNRLNACNNFVNGSQNLIAWTPLPIPFSQSITDNNGDGFQTIGVQNLFAIPFVNASSLAISLNLSSTIITNIQLGCQYIGPLPLANITNAILSQSTQTTTLPTESTSESTEIASESTGSSSG